MRETGAGRDHSKRGVSEKQAKQKYPAGWKTRKPYLRVVAQRSSSCYVPNELRKRMRSGDRPGLQNRRAASSMLPVCSTHTRFRQFSTTCRPRNHSEISSLARAPCERPSSELAPSHPSRCRRKRSSWCGCPRAASVSAARLSASPPHPATSGTCAASCGY